MLLEILIRCQDIPIVHRMMNVHEKSVDNLRAAVVGAFGSYEKTVKSEPDPTQSTVEINHLVKRLNLRMESLPCSPKVTTIRRDELRSWDESMKRNEKSMLQVGSWAALRQVDDRGLYAARHGNMRILTSCGATMWDPRQIFQLGK